MNRDVLSMAFPAGLGALLGAFVSVELDLHLFYGLFVGGIVGYLAFDFRGFLTGVARAYRNTRQIGAPYHSHPFWWKALFAHLPIFFLGLYFLVSTTLLAGARIEAMDGSIANAVVMATLGVIGIVMSFRIVVVIAKFELGRRDKENTAQWKARMDKGIQEARRSWRALLPHNLVISVFQACMRGGKTTIAFLALAFRYVHSHARTQSCAYAMIGVCVGYYFGSAPLGGLAGAGLGYSSYLLVSVRLLKPAIATQRAR